MAPPRAIGAQPAGEEQAMTTGQANRSLLRAVGPDIYRQNAFRLTGLAVTATNRDIRRRGEQLQVAAQFGADAGAAGGTVLPLPEPPGTTAVQQALERLREPAQRLVDELFWIWPARGSGPDEAIAALRRGDQDGALRIWGGQVATGPERAISVHNVAVLLHVRALDDTAVNQMLWQRAVEYWRAVHVDEAFWGLLQARIAELADPRLTSATAGELRAGLLEAVASINAKLAVRAARDNLAADAAAHVALVRDVLLRPEQADRLLRREVEPDLDRIRSISSGAEQSVESDPDRGADAARRFLDETTPLIDKVKFVLAAEQPVVQGLCDEVATTAMYCVIPYVNKTGDFAAGREVLGRALGIAATETARTRIRRNLETARRQAAIQQENLRLKRLSETCWFDKQRPAVDEEAVPRPMWGDEQREPHGYQTRVTWRSTTIRVPRCATCRQAQQRRLRTWRVLAWALAPGWLALNVVPFLVGHGGFVCLTIVATLVGVGYIASELLTLRARKGMTAKEWTGMRQFPPIRDLVAKGWQFGERAGTSS
jgi:hypothetical protein